MNPLIYIHKGYSWYVPLALLNGKQFNSRNVVYLGDAYGCWVARLFGVKSYRIDDYRKSADAFAKIYRHYSSLGHEFELFCIQRWFILTEYLEAEQLESCIYLDTDVLLTKSLASVVAQTLKFGLTYTGYSAHVCFVNRLDAIKQLCQYIMDLYADPASESRFREWHQKMVKETGSGGVSDMTLFYWFQKQHPDVLGDYPAIFGESPIDGSLNDFKEFQRDKRGFKMLTWNNATPFSYSLDNKKIKLVALHHQGRAKSLMRENAKILRLSFSKRVLLTSALDFIYKLILKIK